MKCPKCDYLGFDTGNRCRNCGYDFSLLETPQAPAPDLSLSAPEGADEAGADLSSFPLFPGVAGSDDEPLITMPSAPRAPLAVRRTPDLSRRRPASRAARVPEPELALDFAPEDPGAVAAAKPTPLPTPDRTTAPAPRNVPDGAVTAGLGRRTAAAVTDHLILFGIDLVVLYSTLRIGSLTIDDWRLLPAAPFLAFLLLVKVAYFSTFTAMGGQTIGKMAASIQVVPDEEGPMDTARAFRRTLTGALGVLLLGLGLVPALLDPARRAFHDRMAHTRVIEFPSA